MRYRLLELAGAAAMAVLLLWVPNQAAAQNQKAPAKKPYSPKRLADGHPDLQGTYDIATMTPLERPRGAPPAYTPEVAHQREAAFAKEKQEADAPIAGDRAAPKPGGETLAPKGSTTGPNAGWWLVATGAGGAVGGYNTGWLDVGSTFTVVNGESRSSIVVDPPDGRVPPTIPSARQRAAADYGRPTSDTAESTDRDLERTAGAYDDPERRPLGERCLLGFGSTSGPPALPDYFYNNLHQIVQTPTSVMILTEMVHDARVVRMNGQHLPKNLRFWMGDSVGHWEGDTLVVDTTNFTNKTRFHGSTENLHVVERISRIDDHTLLYRFTVDDPDTWARPWTGEMAWPATDGKIYEYACHEGNYALVDVLKGARTREKEQAAAKAASQGRK
ncbi:MAG TPA: hypothetical protein VKB88_26600 [Bryobacteraceae bacterium]|nr:hypothetical protein [Bryobacteraceae bacterium]